MKIIPSETRLLGHWDFSNGAARADDVCARIEVLTRTYLVKIAVSPDGWDVLFEDPVDRRLWELTYPNSELHGGGPPMLTHVSAEHAHEKYHS